MWKYTPQISFLFHTRKKKICIHKTQTMWVVVWLQPSLLYFFFFFHSSLLICWCCCWEYNKCFGVVTISCHPCWTRQCTRVIDGKCSHCCSTQHNNKLNVYMCVLAGWCFYENIYRRVELSCYILKYVYHNRVNDVKHVSISMEN